VRYVRQQEVRNWIFFFLSGVKITPLVLFPASEGFVDKAAAKVFQILATVFCRARGASDTDLKGAFGRLKRKDRRNSRKLFKVKQAQCFRANTVKRTPVFPKTGSRGTTSNSSDRRLEATIENMRGGDGERKDGRKVAKQRYQDFLGYLRRKGRM
jgi:hypothetical protein